MRQLFDPETMIIKAAKEILLSKGIDALSARAIAKKTGCSVGSIYNYYKNMSELVLTINAETLLSLKKELQLAFRETEKVALSRALVRRYLNFAKQNLPFWNLLYEYKIPGNQLLPKWYQKLIDELFDTVEKGLRPHLPQDSKAAILATRVLWAGLHGILMLETTGKLDIAHKEPAEVLCDSLFDHYLKK